MITKLLLGVGYFFGGFILASLVAVALGFALCAIIGLFNIFRYKWTWALILMYLVLSIISMFLIQFLFFLFGTLGYYTDYKMQKMVFVGFAFPGIFIFKLIPPFIKIALRQTRGLMTE